MRASMIVENDESIERDSETEGYSPFRDDVIGRVRSFDDGSVEFYGYTKAVRKRIDEIRALPRRKRGDEENENRDRNMRVAAKAARKNIRLRVKSVRATHMVTLTTRECISDIARFMAIWDVFRRLMAKHAQFHYIAVPELQKRGAWHMHVAVSGRAALHLARRCWLKAVGGRGNGYCHIRAPKDGHFGKQWRLDALAGYIAKYIGKDLEKHVFNKKRYFTSRGINVPQATTYLLQTECPSVIDAVRDAMYALCEEFAIQDIRCFVTRDGSQYWMSATRPVDLKSV